MENTKPEISKYSNINQIKAALICNLISLNTGMGIGWVSPAIPQILSSESPIGHVTLEQTAWLAGLFPLGAIFATPLVAYLSNKCGRKISIMIWNIPFAINSLIVLFINDINYLLVGRFIMGCGISGCLANVNAYVAEIAQPKIRGKVSVFFSVAFTLGITMSYISGGYFSYKVTAWVMLFIVASSVTACFFIPETPVFLIRKGKPERALRSMAWLRKMDINDENLKLEIINLQGMDNSISLKEAFKILVHDKALRRAFFLINGLFAFQNYMGMFAVHGYTVTIFMEGGVAELSPETSAVIYGCIQISGTLSATQLIDRWGRKVLMTASVFGVAISMLIMGIYFFLKSLDYEVRPYGMISVVSLCCSVYSYSCGAAGMPFVYISDLFTYEVRVYATMIINQMAFLNNFILLRFFAPLSASIGIHYVFFIFCSVSFMAGLYTIVLMPETKGKTTNEILDAMR